MNSRLLTDLGRTEVESERKASQELPVLVGPK